MYFHPYLVQVRILALKNTMLELLKSQKSDNVLNYLNTVHECDEITIACPMCAYKAM